MIRNSLLLICLFHHLIRSQLATTQRFALEELQCFNNKIGDLQCCSYEVYCGTTNSAVLRLKLQNICDLDGIIAKLKPFTLLESLELNDDGINTTEGLDQLTQLRLLSLGGNNIKNVSGIEASAATLQSLTVSFNPLFKFEQLPLLTQLVTLNLESAGLLTLPDISGLTALTNLDLSNNNLVFVEGLETIASNLETIQLAGNPIPCQLLDSYYSAANLWNDRALSEANCALTCSCSSGLLPVQTFAGPICTLDKNCQYGECQIQNALLLNLACNSPTFTDLDSAKFACCRCESCVGITFVSGEYTMRSGPLFESAEGETSVMRILAGKC